MDPVEQHKTTELRDIGQHFSDDCCDVLLGSDLANAAAFEGA